MISMTRQFGGILLVLGTCVGAGMLGLPVLVAPGGLWAGLGILLLCWAVMRLTAFLFLEVTLSQPKEANVVSMVRQTFGQCAAAFMALVYLCFLYAIMSAYTSGAVALLQEGLRSVGQPLSTSAGIGWLSGLFAGVILLGARWVDRVNRLLMLGLVVTYVALLSGLVSAMPSVAPSPDVQPTWLLIGLPVVATSFGFHLLIPSLSAYFNYQALPIRRAITWGSVGALLIYTLWIFMVCAQVPVTVLGEILKSGDIINGLMQTLNALTQSRMPMWMKAFSFFAVTSSFIGVSLGLFDFLKDALPGIRAMRFEAPLRACLTFLPSTLFVLYYPAGFLMALQYAAVFGAILLIILPAAMAQRLRTTSKHERYQAPINMVGLWGLMAFGVGLIGIHFFDQFIGLI